MIVDTLVEDCSPDSLAVTPTESNPDCHQAIVDASLRAASLSTIYATQARKATEPDTRQFLSTIARAKRAHHAKLESMARLRRGSVGSVADRGSEADILSGLRQIPVSARAPLRATFAPAYENATEEAGMYDRLVQQEWDPASRSFYEKLSDWAHEFVFACRAAYRESLSDDFFGARTMESPADR